MAVSPQEPADADVRPLLGHDLPRKRQAFVAKEGRSTGSAALWVRIHAVGGVEEQELSGR